MNDSWANIDLSDVDTPALIIDKDKVKRNIDLALKYAGGPDRLRPHVKTHKMLDVAKMQMAAGIYQYKCATIAEAEMLGMAGAHDVLIAYPVQGPKINRVIKLMKAYPDTTFNILLDNRRTANVVDEKSEKEKVRINYFIDVNNGQNRSGIKTENVESLLVHLNSYKQLNFIGLHCYDGHVRMTSLEERTAACKNALSPVLDLKQKLREKFNREIKIVVGGSPSFLVHAEHHDVVCSPGTFIFWDERYANDYQEQKFEKAAVVATRVISQMDAHTFCLDLGHKSIASEFPFPRVAFIHAEKMEQVGHSEEHLVVRTEKADALRVGDTLLAYPYHVCPTVALHDEAVIISDGEIEDLWPVTARRRRITI